MRIVMALVAVVSVAGSALAEEAQLSAALVDLQAEAKPNLGQKNWNYLSQGEASVLNKGQLAVQNRFSFGRRVGRVSGLHSLQDRLGASYGATDWMEVRASLGWVSDFGSDSAPEFSGGFAFAPVSQKRGMPLEVILEASALREFDGTPVLLAGASVGRDFRRGDVQASATLEKPFSATRDAVDIIFGLGGAAQITQWLRVGAEAIGSDMEAFWEAEEAEGGARLVAGPTAAALFMEQKLAFTLGAQAGAVTLPRPTITGEPSPATAAWVASAALTYTIF